MTSRLFISLDLLALMVALCFAQPAYAVKYVELYQGLPDYETHSPFTNLDKQLQVKLSQTVADIPSTDLGPIDKPCSASSITSPNGEGWVIELSTNVCNAQRLSALKQLVSSLAPTFKESYLTVWIADLRGDGSRDLIVEYVDISNDDSKYPYTSLWQLRLQNGAYRVRYAGPFLYGSLHEIRPFGENPKNRIVFIKHASCLECEPTFYLTPIDFDAGDDAHPYEFTYSGTHDDFGPTIEYELPGMGHTVDATVEVRTLPPSSSGPHLLQYYKMEADEGPDEWWIFSCKHYLCDYEEYKGKAPESFIKLWNAGQPL